MTRANHEVFGHVVALRPLFDEAAIAIVQQWEDDKGVGNSLGLPMLKGVEAEEIAENLLVLLVIDNCTAIERKFFIVEKLFK